MRGIGIDLGLSKIGIAYADGPLAEPLKVVKDIASLKNEIALMCSPSKVDFVVIGIAEGVLLDKAKLLVNDLSKIGIKTYLQDETLTTKDAIDKMIASGRTKKYRRDMEDAVSAALILQSYLDNYSK